jgi:glycolate oxidase
MLPSDTINKLRLACGSGALLTDRVSLTGYESDALAFFRHAPDAVAIPESKDALAGVMKVCREAGVPVVFRGAGTCKSGGPLALQGGVVIHLSRFRNILEINEQDMYCLVEPGVVLDKLNRELKSRGLFYPPDPSSGSVCTIGGNVAENAGGIRCFKYGVTANYILGMEAVLANGDTVQFGGSAGGLGGMEGDWKALMTGSEGMLAAFTKIWLRLCPLPEKAWTFLAGFRSREAAIAAVEALMRMPAVPVALELLDNRTVGLVENSDFAVGLNKDCCYLLSELDGPAEIADRQAEVLADEIRRRGAESLVYTGEEEERQKLWRARKAFGGLLGQISASTIAEDVVVPTSRIGEVLDYIYTRAEALDIEVAVALHAGDGNMHPNFLFDSGNEAECDKVRTLCAQLIEKVIACDGAISGEHGIGSDKAGFIPLVMGEREMALQRCVLNCFNPDDRLNPGKLLPSRRFQKAVTP